MLIDTHIFLWSIQNNPRLSSAMGKRLEAADHVYLSVVSLWEIAIKLQIGKLSLGYEFSELYGLLEQVDIHLIGVEASDVNEYIGLPLHHRDPFDRMIVAQSIARSLPLVSADSVFDYYPIVRIWDS
ncbi:MAG: type II toxin-antitoxin system VapC family toxin [Oscillatoriales cyanobacterium]|jgi:PIN domain nuclease of toxin-antitoxin system|nr:MAG: type II toxin-antitoxin system VapC family toxin [Oscillatoriales cyanobacterium]